VASATLAKAAAGADI